MRSKISHEGYFVVKLDNFSFLSAFQLHEETPVLVCKLKNARFSDPNLPPTPGAPVAAAAQQLGLGAGRSRGQEEDGGEARGAAEDVPGSAIND